MVVSVQVCEFLCAALGLAREDMRLWSLGSAAVLLDDERPTLQALRLGERARLLLELRNPDLTWPEEIGALRYRANMELARKNIRHTMSPSQIFFPIITTIIDYAENLYG